MPEEKKNLEHKDVGQRYLKLDDGRHDFWTFCSCGKAFRGLIPDDADGAWSQHADPTDGEPDTSA